MAQANSDNSTPAPGAEKPRDSFYLPTDIYGYSDGVDLEQDDCDSEDADPDECKLQPPEMGGVA